MPATAHGLQGRFNARTVTERKYPGVCLIRRGQPRLRLRHGLYRYSRPQSENTMETEVTAGLSPGTSTLRIRVSFYSVFNLPERSVRASGQLVPRLLRLSDTISFSAGLFRLKMNFSDIFPYSGVRAGYFRIFGSLPRLRLWQCRSCSCRGRNGRRCVSPVCRADWI